jgi:hypothetical protein
MRSDNREAVLRRAGFSQPNKMMKEELDCFSLTVMGAFE